MYFHLRYPLLIQDILMLLTDKRLACTVRREVPALFFTIPVLLSQLLCSAVPLNANLLLGIAVSGGYAIRRLCGGAALVSFLLGVLSTVPIQKRVVPLQREAHGTLMLKVKQRPRHRRNEQQEVSLEIVSVFADLRAVVNAGESIDCRGVYLPWQRGYQLQPGDIFAANVRLRRIPASFNPFSYANRQWRRGIVYACDFLQVSQTLARHPSVLYLWRSKIVRHVQEAVGNNEGSGFLLAATLGVKDSLSRQTENAFRQLGLSHLLVVSGLHFGIFCTYLNFILSVLAQGCRAKLRYYTKFYLRFSLIPLSYVYVMMVGSGLATQRAFIATSIFFIARQWSRGHSFFNTYCMALLLTSLLWPGALWEIGPLYTWMALWAIGLALDARSSNATRVVHLSVLASVATLAVSVGFFGTVTPLSPVFNVVFTPILSFLFCALPLLAMPVLFIDMRVGGFLLLQLWELYYVARALFGWIVGSIWLEFEVGMLLRVAIPVVIVSYLVAKSWRQFCFWALQRNVLPQAMQRASIPL